MTRSHKEYCQLLNVSEDASLSEIRKSFRSLLTSRKMNAEILDAIDQLEQRAAEEEFSRPLSPPDLVQVKLKPYSFFKPLTFKLHRRHLFCELKIDLWKFNLKLRKLLIIYLKNLTLIREFSFVRWGIS